MTGQSKDAAERSAHVQRGGEAAAPAPSLFSGPEFGPVKLRVVAELEAENARLRAELEAARRGAASGAATAPPA